MAQPKDEPDASSSQPQAGTVIQPSNPEKPAAVPEPTPAAVPQPPPEPAAPLPQPAPLPAKEPDVEPAEPQAPAAEPTDDSQSDDNQQITWTASEFVAHDKSAGWYLLLAVGTLILAAGVFLLMRDLVSTSVIIVAGLLLGVYAGHQPRQLEYALNNRGLTIGSQHHSYDEFKWFSVMQEGAFSSIVFMPLKRFAVPTTIYYPPEDEDPILAILTNCLPMEEHKHDAVDSLMRRIRF